MEDSAGKNNLYFIKSDRFNDVYLEYLREFYVNKYRSAADIQEVYAVANSTFSEAKSKVFNALGMESYKGKYGEPISFPVFSENSKLTNVFHQLYSHCLHKDSLYFLTCMLVFSLARKYRSDIRSLIDESDNHGYYTQADKYSELLELKGPAPICTSVFSNCGKKCTGKGCCPWAEKAKACGDYKSEGVSRKEFQDLIKYANDEYERATGKRFKFAENFLYNDPKTVVKKLNRFENQGLAGMNGTRYYLTNRYLSDLSFARDPMFISYIEFMSEIAPFGYIGTGMLDKRLIPHENQIFRFSDRFIFNTLNDYNLIDCLHAIKYNKMMHIHYVDRERKIYDKYIYPLGIRQSTVLGRQFLVYYEPKVHSVSALRLEFINTITMEEFSFPSEDTKAKFDREVSNARRIVEHCFGSGFGGFKEGNCMPEQPKLDHVRIEFEISEDAGYIVDRIKREKRLNCLVFTKAGDEKYILEGPVTFYMDMVPWVNSLSKYVAKFDYIEAEHKVNNDKADFELEYHPVKDKPSEDYLFCQENSLAYKELIRLYFRIVNGEKVSREEYEKTITILKKYKKDKCNETYGDARVEFFDFLSWVSESGLLDSDKNDSRKELPLSRIEMDWLRNIAESRYAELFLDKGQIDELKEFTRGTDPLFDLEDIHYYDADSNDIVNSAAIFRTLVTAISEHKKITADYEKENLGAKVFSPESITYSHKVNNYKLNCLDEEGHFRILRIDRIKSVQIGPDDIPDPEELEKKVDYELHENMSTIKIGLINTNKNIDDRFLRDLSSYTHDCRRNDLYDLDTDGKQKIKTILQNQALDCPLDVKHGDKKYSACRIVGIRKREYGKLEVDLSSSDGNVTVPASELPVDSHKISKNTNALTCSFDESFFELVVTICCPESDNEKLFTKISSYGNEMFVIFDNSQSNRYIIDKVNKVNDRWKSRYADNRYD